MGHPVVHYEIRAKDPDAARTFYGELFGWTFADAAEPGYTYVEVGDGATIPGGIGKSDAGGLVTFFVGVEDVDAALETAQRLGGTVVRPATSVPGVTFGLFADAEGNVVGVASTS